MMSTLIIAMHAYSSKDRQNILDAMDRFTDDASQLYESSPPPPFKKYMTKLQVFLEAGDLNESSFQYAFSPVREFLEDNKASIVSDNFEVIMKKEKICYGKASQIYIPIGRILFKVRNLAEDHKVIRGHLLSLLHLFFPSESGTQELSELASTLNHTSFGIDTSTPEGLLAARLVSKLSSVMDLQDPNQFSSDGEPPDVTVLMSKMLTNPKMKTLMTDMQELASKKNVRMSRVLKIVMNTIMGRLEEIEDKDETEDGEVQTAKDAMAQMSEQLDAQDRE